MYSAMLWGLYIDILKRLRKKGVMIWRSRGPNDTSYVAFWLINEQDQALILLKYDTELNVSKQSSENHGQLGKDLPSVLTALCQPMRWIVSEANSANYS